MLNAPLSDALPTTDAPLRADAELLAKTLTDVLTALGSPGLKEDLAALRDAARKTRAHVGEDDADAALVLLCRDVAPEVATERVRALSHHFAYLNVAEQVHRIRRRRSWRAVGNKDQAGSLADVCCQLAQQGHSLQQLQATIDTMRVVPVFTAHPTEPTRRTLLRKERRVAHHLIALQRPDLLPDERQRLQTAIQAEMGAAWQTEELPGAPEVSDEAEHVIFYLTQVIYEVIPAIDEGIDAALNKAFGPGLALHKTSRSPVVTFGTWVGGDMDGNPNVGAKTLIATLAQSRMRLIDRYIVEADRLRDHLSQTTSRGVPMRRTQARLGELQAKLPDVVIPPRHRDMPFRILLHYVVARLRASAVQGPGAYLGPQALIKDLSALHDDLIEAGPNLDIHAPVRRLLRRVETFGLHLATLDIRQDSLVHRHACATLLGDDEFIQAPIYLRVQALDRALATAGQMPISAAMVKDITAPLGRTLDVLRAIKEARQTFGTAAVGPYIISMAEDIDDVLALLLLAHTAGLGVFSQASQSTEVDLDISPLFETVPDLERAGATLAAMLEHPRYRQHIRSRGDIQHVMIGYSDSNKASGLVASRWALQQAQRTLRAVGASFGVKVILFHGRGGTASRGGSRPRQAVLAEPPGTVMGQLRLTEQGENIHGKYGHEDLALRSLELLGGAVLEVSVAKTPAHVPQDFLAALSTCAGASRAAYCDLTDKTPQFFAYFRAATPIDAIARLRIGSRPASRRTQSALSDLRAIPWVFSWMQNRQMLPGWYGLGHGLEAVIQAMGIDILRDMHQRWPFFKTLLTDACAVLATADMTLGAHYAQLGGEACMPIWHRIRADYDKTCSLVLEVTQGATLLDDAPVLARALVWRNPDIYPLHLMQVDLLRRWRVSDRQDTAIEEALLLTLKGIARGLHATG